MTTAKPPGEQAYTLSLKEGWLRWVESVRQRPRRLTRDELTGLAPRERWLREEECHVWHANLGPFITPAMHSVLDELSMIALSNRQDGDKVRTAAVLDAPPGLGKSTLGRKFGRDFHRQQLEMYGPETAAGQQRWPVAWVDLSANTTRRSLSVALARFYGHPGAERGNADKIGAHAADCIMTTETRLGVIDDVHFLNMLRRDGRELANYFKWMQNTFPMTFLFIGVGLADRGLFTEGLAFGQAELAQTGRRWVRLSLSPLEVQTEEGRDTWRRLLLTIEQQLVLVDARPGDLADRLPDYLYARSSGHFASLMTLVRLGCFRAIRNQEERLTEQLLDKVRIDEAAEARSQELLSAFRAGRLTTRPGSAAKRGGARSAGPARAAASG